MTNLVPGNQSPRGLTEAGHINLLPGVLRPRLAQPAQAVLALLAVALLAAVARVALADADAAATGRAVEQHVRRIDRHFLREPAALRVAAIGPHVLVDAIHALDDEL